jgi:glycosyltransferase involved in cell wall biosynthesis
MLEKYNVNLYMAAESAYAIVVTYNRLELLKACLLALKHQTISLGRIVVIDNASTDGTQAWVETIGLLDNPYIIYVRMKENMGGAGGFAEGMRNAFELGAEWVWMMDDDAVPYPEALEKLLKVATSQNDVYGSLAVNGSDTAWTTTLLEQDGAVVNLADSVPDLARVRFLPFLGFMVHRSLVERIGLPEIGFFIAADDVEYCLRAERAGARIFIAGKSRIEHPKSSSYVARLPGRKLICLQLPPWKRYYDTRNRLLIARKYYGYRLWTQTVPGSFVRMIAVLIYEPRKAAQLHAFFAGFIDGLLGRVGKRHTYWGIT